MAASTLSPVPPIEAAFPADAVVNPKTHSATQLPKDHDSAPSASQRAKSALFTPLTINAGGITLSHRIVMAPMTRNRGIPVNIGRPNRAWKPSPSVATYYAQRATPGGLIITEGIPPSQEGTGSPAVPGLFLPEQVPGWKAVVDAVHAKGGYIYAQLWHGGRACLPHFTGLESVSASATPFGEGMESRYPPPDEDADDAIPGHGDRVAMSDFPPREMTKGDIAKTISDFVSAARRAVEECGFDGIEIHGGNGYIVEQFLSTNVNKRFDEYGGSVEGYCRFPLELMQGLAEAVGGQRVAIRLSPFGMFNQSYGAQRMEIWSHFCRRLKDAVPNLSYIHFIEPRFEQIIEAAAKDSYLKSLGNNVTLQPFREIMGNTPFFIAGGYNDTNVWGVVESGAGAAITIGRYFTSNPDLVTRLREGKALAKYDRSRFYWVPDNMDRGYIDFPCLGE